jgi:hypothetical protein
MNLFPPNPGQAPRRAFRGKGRYFRKVHRDAASFRLQLRDDPWWNYWHYHADWPGWGNLGWSYRRPHVSALCLVFDQIASARARMPRDHQLWIMLHAFDAGQDATYLHSQNPHGSPFPLLPEGVVWGVPELEEVFRKLLPARRMRVGRVASWDGDPPRETSSYFAYDPEIGIPLD